LPITQTSPITVAQTQDSPCAENPTNRSGAMGKIPGMALDVSVDLVFSSFFIPKLYIAVATTKRFSPKVENSYRSRPRVTRDAGGMIPDPPPRVN